MEETLAQAAYSPHEDELNVKTKDWQVECPSSTERSESLEQEIQHVAD